MAGLMAATALAPGGDGYRVMGTGERMVENVR